PPDLGGPARHGAAASRAGALARLAGFDPPPEDSDTLGRPRSVAGHRPGLEPAEDGVGVCRDLLGRPEIEGETHRVAVALPEQRLDVGLETHRPVLSFAGSCLAVAGRE